MRVIFYLIISLMSYAISNIVCSKVKFNKNKVLNIFLNIVIYIIIWFVIYGLCLLLLYLLFLLLLELGGAPAQH